MQLSPERSASWKAWDQISKYLLWGWIETLLRLAVHDRVSRLVASGKGQRTIKPRVGTQGPEMINDRPNTSLRSSRAKSEFENLMCVLQVPLSVDTSPFENGVR